MHFQDPQDWPFPVPIVYGPGRLGEIASLCRRAGMTAPLIVTDRGSADLPFIAETERLIRDSGLACAVHSNISPNPRDEEIAEGRRVFRAGGHDGVIAIGGGSGMDGAKAICLTANNSLDLWAFEYEQPSPDMAGQPPFPPLICIPTTAGTGAETESTAMVTDTGRAMKFCVWHQDLKPSFALLDPRLTVGLPPHLTAWTGVDAMVHAIEAFCVPGFNPPCDGMGLEGLSLLSHWLPIAFREPDNLDARGAMLAGSCLAGVSFLKGLGLVHAISHMVGAEFDTQHGLTNAILLPAVLRFNRPEISHKIKVLTQVMGIEDPSFEGLHSGVCALLDDLQIPNSLGDIGVPPDCAGRIAAKAIRDSAAATNPRRASVHEIEAILAEALIKGR